MCLVPLDGGDYLARTVKISKNSVALAGEYAVLSQLMLKGFDAAMTLGHTKGVDILVSYPSGKQCRVEVKTNLDPRQRPTDSKPFGLIETSWQMHKDHENNRDKNLFYCFVHINPKAREQNPPGREARFFIVPNAVVAKYVKEQHRAWLREKDSHRDSHRRVFRIGRQSERRVKVPAPLAEDHEDRWDLLFE
jgi:hypothetical protein